MHNGTLPVWDKTAPTFAIEQIQRHQNGLEGISNGVSTGGDTLAEKKAQLVKNREHIVLLQKQLVETEQQNQAEMEKYLSIQEETIARYKQLPPLEEGTTWSEKVTAHAKILIGTTNGVVDLIQNKTTLDELQLRLTVDLDFLIKNPNATDRITCLNIGEKLQILLALTQSHTTTNTIIMLNKQAMDLYKNLCQNFDEENKDLSEEISALELKQAHVSSQSTARP